MVKINSKKKDITVRLVMPWTPIEMVNVTVYTLIILMIESMFR